MEIYIQIYHDSLSCPVMYTSVWECSSLEPLHKIRYRMCALVLYLNLALACPGVQTQTIAQIHYVVIAVKLICVFGPQWAL